MPDPLTRSRRIMWGGFLLHTVVGMGWDSWWHSRNPGGMETGWAVVEAHGPMYLGILIVAAGALWAFRAADRPLSPWSGYGLAALGGVGAAIGMGWDSWGHAAGSEVALAHLLSRVGLLLVLVGLTIVSLRAWTQQRSGRPA